jgi:hypothetical protein
MAQPKCIFGVNNSTCYVKECEVCDPIEGCILQPGWCRVNGNCYENGHFFTTKNGISNCQVCDINRSTTSFSWAYTGAWCSDSIYCNGEDSCVASENADSSTCTAHSGDPCLGNEFCNNTCSETHKNCFREKEECGEQTSCASMECSSGSCLPIPFPVGTVCGNETLCDISTCLDGHCLTVSKPDGTSCGNDSFPCLLSTCISGQCEQRPPYPLPHCDTCPCVVGYSCNELSGICEQDIPSQSSSSGKQTRILIEFSILGLIAVSLLLLIALALLYLKRIAKTSDSNSSYTLLDTDEYLEGGALIDAGSKENRAQNGEKSAPVTVKVVTRRVEGGGQSKKLTKYVREDEPPQLLRVINKKL